VFNATGRVSSGDLEAIETLKRRFGAARFLERAVAVFTHADVLIADDGDAKDDEDENEIAASYLRDAPPALASLLRAAGGGEPVFADVRARGVADTTRTLTRTPEALAEAVRRVDRVVARSPLRSASGDPNETRVVAADVAAAAEARLPRLGMKAARRRRQEARKHRNIETSNDDAATTRAIGSADWVGDAFAWFSSVVAPPPSKPEPATLVGEKKEPEKIKASRDG